MTTETVHLLLPEIVLIAVAVAIYIGGAFVDARKEWSWIAGGGLLLAAGALWLQRGHVATLPEASPVAFDALAYYGRWLALVFGGLLLLLASRPLDTDGTSEYVGSLLLLVAGLMFAAGAGELVLLFVGLELISIPTYILLYLGGRGAASQEATLKYFFLSIIASAMLLYGFCFLYGATGATNLAEIRADLLGTAGPPAALGPLALVAMVMIFAGLAFKIAAVPFHFYAPDVYQGTTHPNAAVLSVVPKAAGMIVLVRLIAVAMPTAEPYAWRVTMAVAVLTMTLGNVIALWQDHLRRLLAYSSIAHAGYMLIGLTVGLASAAANWDGIAALLFYLAVYAVATIGTFAALEYLGRGAQRVEAVDELAGLGRTRPATAAMLAVFMFSLAGIPPLAGFWGKLLLFGSALSVDTVAMGGASLRPWFFGLAVIGVLNAAVAAAYYLRIVAVMYFRTPLATPKAQGGLGARSAAVVCAVLTIAIGLWPGPLIERSTDASPSAVKPSTANVSSASAARTDE